jgi:uncharacterized ion transporter superfamily protein YfcC
MSTNVAAKAVPDKEQSTEKKKFTFPSAFTILFLLLIVIALATWIVPAGSYDYDEDGAPIPGTYHAVEANPQKLLQSALKGPINGMYGIEAEDGSVTSNYAICSPSTSPCSC